MVKKLIEKFREKYNSYSKNVYFRAIVLSLITFFCLRIFTSSVLLIEIILPSPEPPYSEVTQEILTDLELQSDFTRLFLAPWYRWDTARYLEIADFGYDFNFINTVWPPLYPFLIKIFSFVFQPSVLAALIVSNLFFVVGLFLTYLLTKEIFNEEAAKKSLFFIVIFPTSFYFVAGYSESIFLVLSAGAFLLLRKKKWLWAGFLSALAVLTRVQGIILVVPIFIELLRDYFKNRNLKQLMINSISIVYAPFVYGLYSFYVYFGLRVDWPWNMLSTYWDQHFGLPWEGIIGTINSFFIKEEILITPPLMKIVNIFLPILTIYLLIRMRKRIPLSISVYSWLMLFMILGKIDQNNMLVSSIRYLLVIFPVYWGLVIMIKNKLLNFIYFTGCILLQIIQMVYFYWWVWVA
jgi:Gpi18-like mannosyltransferase